MAALGERPKKVRKADKFENSFVLMSPETTCMPPPTEAETVSALASAAALMVCGWLCWGAGNDAACEPLVQLIHHLRTMLAEVPTG